MEGSLVTISPGGQFMDQPVQRYRYHLNGLTLAMLAAALLDTATTSYFLSTGVGYEANPVLAPLASVSLWWVPTYLLLRPLVTPLMPDVSRQTFAVSQCLIGTLCGLNNLSGIFLDYYFIVDNVGFIGPGIIAVICGCCIWSWLTRRRLRAGQGRLGQYVRSTVLWLAIFGLMEITFWGLGCQISNGHDNASLTFGWITP